MSMFTISFLSVCVCMADNTNGCTNKFPDIRMTKSRCNHSASMDISPIEMPPAVSVFDAREANLPPNMHTESPDFIPRCEDVIFGRGGRTNHHPGNVRLCEIVKFGKPTIRRKRSTSTRFSSRLLAPSATQILPVASCATTKERGDGKTWGTSVLPRRYLKRCVRRINAATRAPRINPVKEEFAKHMA